MTSPPRPSSVLVLDGDERAALAAARALVASGYAVAVLASSAWSLASCSRGVRRLVRSHDPLTAPEAYAEEVAGLATRLNVSMVIPVTDASADALLSHRGILPEGLRLPFAAFETYRAASDKVRVHELALSAGIGIEETVVVASANQPAPEDPRLYPGFVKPHRSVVGGAARRKTGVRAVSSREQCAAVLRELHPDAFPVLVQRAVRGAGEGVFVARWAGRTLARFAHRRLREKPPAGGVSVFRESVALDPDIAAACDRMLDALEWEGVAMIEGKRDDDRGGWRVMEINGRFWGSLQLAVDAGVDFPSLLVRAVKGEDTGPLPSWRTGVRLRWEWGDIDHLLIRLRRSRAALRLPADAPGRLGAIAAFLTHRRHDRLEVFRWDDPMPFFAETARRIGLV